MENTIIHCSTKEEFIDVQQKLIDKKIYWFSNTTVVIEHYWANPSMYLITENGSFFKRDHDKLDEYKNRKGFVQITAQEFLHPENVGTKENELPKRHDYVRIIEDKDHPQRNGSYGEVLTVDYMTNEFHLDTVHGLVIVNGNSKWKFVNKDGNESGFKVGDKIRIRYTSDHHFKGRIVTITKNDENDTHYSAIDSEGRTCGIIKTRERTGELVLEDESLNNNIINKPMSMNLREKFTLALTKEPQRSFRKVGVTDGDDILTDEGMKVFCSWLLNTKHADEFNKEVVSDMVKKCKEDKKDEGGSDDTDD